VSEKIEFLLKLTAERAVVRFSELFGEAASRAEIVCTFLALLELIRLKQLACVQGEDFGEIEIKRAVAAQTPQTQPAPN
jgi:segregation and condensation protein A